MRLVTFRIGGVETAPPARAGALTDGGRTVVQLAAPSVLAIVEGGPNAMDRAAEALKRPSREAIFPIEQVTLLAPIPQPPQMRDFLCFEKHLQQAFAAVAKLRGTEARIPKIWYERPIFYHPNRFNRSEEHTSELQSRFGISYAVFCLKKKKHHAPAHSTGSPDACRDTATTPPRT